MSDVRTVAVRADDLISKRQVFRVFSGRGSAQVFVSGVFASAIARLLVGGFGVGDLVVCAATVALIGPVEWVLHRSVLHARDDSWSSRRLGTGSGHRRHHQDPPDLDWLLLGGVDSLAALAALGVLTAGWVGALGVASGTPAIGPFLTGWALTGAALVHYEWVHLLIHSRYRCRTRYYRRLAANHRRHHHRNERFWLGVTSNSGDRLLGTLPARASSVPLSATARTLDDHA